MASPHRRWGRGRILLGTGATFALLASWLVTPAQAALPDIPPAIPCPAAVPLASVNDTMTGYGYTTVRGTTPLPFAVQVLGILDDGIGAGKDLIIIEASDVNGKTFIADNGIWAGISGSPVYVDGKLLGALGYGFSTTSPIGGVTPAEDMYALLDNPALKGKAVKHLNRAALDKIVRKAGVAAPKGSFQAIPTPASVSGLNSKRLARFQKDADSAGLGIRAFPGGRAKATAAPTSTPVPGGNFAGVAAYGDFTYAAAGTVTAVCGTQALAFGHPFDQTGKSTLGANDATTVTLVPDKSFGSYKLFNVGGSFGTLDQDRLVGVRANLTATPTTTPITTVITNGDTKKSRTGVTQVTDPSYLAASTFYAALANYDAIYDELGDGRATSSWTIKGTRLGGKAFTVSRSNQWASQSDATEDPAFDVADTVDSLVNNQFEAVKITSVSFSSTIHSRFKQLHISKVAVSVNGGAYSKAQDLTVKPGAKLAVKVTLGKYQSTATRTSVLNVTVPKTASGFSGELDVAGGLDLAGFDDDSEDDSGCLLGDDGCSDDTQGSLDSLISSITSQPRNDDLVAELALDSGDDTGDDDSSASVVAKDTKSQQYTVAGEKLVSIEVS